MFSEAINKTVKETFNQRSVKGDFGVEIETEGRNLPPGKITSDFSGHEDGSLRQGMEYVSIPLQKKNVFSAVNSLRERLEKAGAVLKPTYRSSTHIHHNFIDNKWSDVLGAVIGWTIIEPVILDSLPHRNGSLFCMPSFDTGDAVLAIDHLCSSLARGSVTYEWNYRGKYSSQNLLRLSDLGTIEYRVFPTSVDGEEIDKWCGWIANIKDYAEKAEDKTYLSLVEYAEQNPFDFCGSVCNGKPPVEDRKIPGLIDFGARHAYELARVIADHMKRPAPKEEEKPKKKLHQFNVLDDVVQMRADPVQFARWIVQPVHPAQANDLAGAQLGANPLLREDVPAPVPVVEREEIPVPRGNPQIARVRERIAYYQRRVAEAEEHVQAQRPGWRRRLISRKKFLENFQREHARLLLEERNR